MAQVAIVPLIELSLPNRISTFSRYGPGIEMEHQATGILAATDWSAANTATLYQITLPIVFTVRAFNWVSGTVVAGSYDIGVYDQNFALLRSIGSKPHPGGNSLRFEAITPLTLQPGNYWLAFVADDATFGIVARPAFAGRNLRTIPIRGAAASFPLPLTITATTTPGARLQSIALANNTG